MLVLRCESWIGLWSQLIPELRAWLNFDWDYLYIMLNDHLKSGKYVGNRPIKLRKSNWKERTDHEALERQKVLFPILHRVKVFFLACSMCSSSLCGVHCFLDRTTIKRNRSFRRRVSCTSENKVIWRECNDVEQSKELFVPSSLS